MKTPVYLLCSPKSVGAIAFSNTFIPSFDIFIDSYLHLTVFLKSNHKSSFINMPLLYAEASATTAGKVLLTEKRAFEPFWRFRNFPTVCFRLQRKFRDFPTAYFKLKDIIGISRNLVFNSIAVFGISRRPQNTIGSPFGCFCHGLLAPRPLVGTALLLHSHTKPDISMYKLKKRNNDQDSKN